MKNKLITCKQNRMTGVKPDQIVGFTLGDYTKNKDLGFFEIRLYLKGGQIIDMVTDFKAEKQCIEWLKNIIDIEEIPQCQN